MDKCMPKILSGNQLKIIAALAMTIDHIGVMMFPRLLVLRIIGRIALPIFAYMIAEGCHYTKSKKKYALTLFAVAFLCQIVYFVAMKSLMQCILVTFLMSVLLIFSLEEARKKRDLRSICLFAITLIVSFLICEVLPLHIKGFSVDYGFAGVVLPLLIYIGRGHREKVLLCAVGLLLLNVAIKGVQVYSFLSLIFLCFYNGERGKWRLKYFFYIYYPLHLGVIYLISLL